MVLELIEGWRWAVGLLDSSHDICSEQSAEVFDSSRRVPTDHRWSYSRSSAPDGRDQAEGLSLTPLRRLTTASTSYSISSSYSQTQGFPRLSTRFPPPFGEQFSSDRHGYSVPTNLMSLVPLDSCIPPIVAHLL